MRNQVKREESSLGLVLGISAVLMMGYAVGSPQVAPMLPPSMERPFANMHKELHEVGAKAARSAADTWQKAAGLVFG